MSGQSIRKEPPLQPPVSKKFPFEVKNKMVNRRMSDGPFYCYLIANVETGRGYVGITRNLENRWQQHLESTRYGSKLALHVALRARGVAAFQMTQLGTAQTWEDVQVMEREFIALLQTKRPFGYNMTDGGEGVRGCEISEETRVKLRLTLADPVVKAKMRAAKLGKTLAPEHVKKIVAKMHAPTAREKARATNSGRARSGQALENIRAGCQKPERIAKCVAAMHSPEARAKARESLRLTLATPEAKARRSAASTGRIQSAETRAKKAELMRAIHAARQTSDMPSAV